MRFEQVAQRLTQLPAHLPAAPPSLLPVLLPDARGRLPSPSWPAQPSRDAAVLLLIHPDEEGRAQIVLTERAAGGHRHAGQISFPGGAIDEGDESVVAAALREASEEVGLDPRSVGVLVVGQLAPVDVRVSGFRVHPVVATAPRVPRLSADRREVATILHAPISAFLPGAPIEMVTAERDGFRLRYGAYRLGDHLVWGATASILGRLGALLAEDH
jgi:8-oxo-dGTP pyrophosphatase MutT (NUDIX family)